MVSPPALNPGSSNNAADISQIAAGAGINFIGTVFRAVFGFAFSILISRTLIVSDLGLYTLGSTIVLLLSYLCVLGLDAGLWRYISSYRASGDHPRLIGAIKGSLYLAVPFSLALAAILIIFAPYISNSIFREPGLVSALRIFALTLPMLVSARLFNAATQGLQHMQYTAIRDTVEQGLRLFLTAGLFIAGLRLGGALLANLAAILAVTILSFYFLEKVQPIRFRKSYSIMQIRTLVKFSAPMGFSAILSYLLLWMDTLFLGYFRSADEVGLYSVAIRVIVVAAIVQTSFNTMFAPVISDLFTRRKQSELEQLFKRVTRWIFTMSLPIFLPLIMFAPDVLGVFGDEFRVVAGSLLILTLGQLVNVITGPVGGMISMTGRSRLELMNSVAAWTLGVVLCVTLIPRWGITGAAIANASAAALVNLIRAGEVWGIMGVHAYSTAYIKPLAAAAVAATGSVLGFKALHFAGNLASLFIWSAVFMALYIGMILVMGLDEEDAKVAKSIRSRFTRAHLT